MSVTPVILLILDGFGYREDITDNAIAQAHKPNWDRLWKTYPHALINASEGFVGLPAGQMGNSEVGHLNMGAGRVVFQDFERINNAIETGSFFENPVLAEAVQTAKTADKAIHIFGLVSDGGVHSHQEHIHAMVEMTAKAGLSKVYVHAFLDGRDTPPISAKPYLQALEDKCTSLGVGKIASICGRYYAMDRDKRWERVAPAYKLVTEGIGEFTASSALAGLEAAYARGENDEFVKATAIVKPGEAPVHMQDGDVVVFMNFVPTAHASSPAVSWSRISADSNVITCPSLAAITRSPCTTRTRYMQKPHSHPPTSPTLSANTFPSGVEAVTHRRDREIPACDLLFNGGEEKVFDGEDRIMVPSPKVATYDLKPEMSAFELTDKLVEAIHSKSTTPSSVIMPTATWWAIAAYFPQQSRRWKPSTSALAGWWKPCKA